MKIWIKMWGHFKIYHNFLVTAPGLEFLFHKNYFQVLIIICFTSFFQFFGKIKIIMSLNAGRKRDEIVSKKLFEKLSEF